MMKKYVLIIFLGLFAIQMSLAQSDSTFVDSDKITLSLLTHFSFFQSVNVGFEKQLKPRRSLETELAFIYSSIYNANTKGIIWRNTFKFFEKPMKNRRLFIGPQIVLHYHRITQEAVFSHLGGLYFEKDDLFREKFRASLMGVLGEEWGIGKQFLVEVNVGLGVKYDTVKMSQDNIGELESIVDNNFRLRRARPLFLPDGNVALKIKYKLNS